MEIKNCTINIYIMGNKTRDEADLESDDEEMEEGFYNPFEEAVNHAIDVLKGAANGSSLHD